VCTAFEFERPHRSIKLGDQNVYGVNSDDNASIALGVGLRSYDPDSEFDGYDCVRFNVTVMANTRKLDYSEMWDTPYFWIDESDYDQKVVYTGVGDDWGVWLNLSVFWGVLGNDFRFKFYHAKYRSVEADGEWTCVWISSNGFISFDVSEHKGGEPASLSNPQAPNAFLAPLWTDLVVDEQASIIVGYHYHVPPYPPISNRNYFVVTWRNVRVKNTATRLTFQTVLLMYTAWEDEQDRQGLETSVNGLVYFNYNHTENINRPFTYGIENHDGSLSKGAGRLSGSNLASFNGKTIKFEAEGYYNFIKNLYLEAQDSNTNSRCGIPDAFGFPRGHNVKTKTDPPPQPDDTGSWERLLASTSNWLLGFGGYLAQRWELIEFSVAPITIPVGAVILAWGYYDQFAKAQYNSTDVVERVDGQRAYIKVPANRTDGYPSYVQDATLDVILYWLLTDSARDQPHTLTIKATVEYGYAAYSWNLTTTITDVKVNPDKGKNSFDLAEEIHEGTYNWLYIDDDYDHDDYYRVYVPYYRRVCVTIAPTLPNNTNYDLYLYNSTRHIISISENPAGQAELVQGDELRESSWWYIKVNATNGGFGFYSMSVSFQQLRILNISASDGGTTNPPPGTYAYVEGMYATVTAFPDTANGYYLKCWVLDGVAYYNFSNTINVLMNTDHSLTAVFSNFTGGGPSEPCPTLFVWNDTAWIDYGVIDIHNPTGEDVVREVQVSKEEVGVSSYTVKFRLREGWPGLEFSESVIDQVKLYAIINGNRYLCPLISATHSTQGNVWLRLILSDDYKTQMLLLETIDLTFLMPYPTSQVQDYIFIIEGCNMLKI
jgi:hypothetical protein